MNLGVNEADASERPLAGVVVCCTSVSVEQRDALARIAGDLGASYNHDLTSDVTHLLVGRIDTAKYQYVAKERPDVKVLRTEWLEAVRDAWMGAEKVDVPSLEDTHRTPTFWGLCICISGWQELDERQAIITAISENGAEYRGNLTAVVSHLVVKEPTGKKYQWAKENGVKVVSYEWITQSLERGMALGESFFNPLMPEGMRGHGAWRKLEDLGSPYRKRSRREDPAAARVDAHRRKLRRTASAKIESQSASIWSDITGGVSQPKQMKNDDDWQGPDHKQTTRANLESARDVPDESQETSTIPAATSHGAPRRSAPKGAFQGSVIYIHGFDARKRDQIVKFTNGHNARIMSTPKELAQCTPEELEDGFLVIPHHLALEDLPPLPPQAGELQHATEWWLERCLVSKRLIDPSSDPFCLPFANLAVRGFEGVGINGTGFSGADLLHVKKLINLLGATYEEYFLPTTSILVCNTTREDKLEFATSHDIPAVSLSWIWKCVEKGKIQPLGPYLLNKIDANVADKALKSTSSTSGPSRATFSDTSKADGQSDPSRGSSSNDRPAAPKNQPHMGESGAADSMLFDGPAIQPALNELPHTNSPKKASYPATTHAEPFYPLDLDENENPTHKPDAAHHHPDGSSARSEALRSEIDALRAQFASRPTSAGGLATEPRISRRARGKLGRAVSGGHAASNPSLSRATSEGFSPAVDDDRPDDAAEAGLPGDEPVASQAIVYEDPEIKQRREDMIRRMGGYVEERTVGVERVGSAKDFTGAESGIAGRVAGARRRGN